MLTRLPSLFLKKILKLLIDKCTDLLYDKNINKLFYKSYCLIARPKKEGIRMKDASARLLRADIGDILPL